MKKSQAIKMFSAPDRVFSDKEVWTDFGCGTGTFTLALAHLLGPNSRIIAVDTDINSLKQIPDQFREISITKKHADFLKVDFPPESLNGILMANSLHYVENQTAFIETAQQFLKPEGCFLIVEYDTSYSNPWIPFPVGFNRLKEVFEKAGFSTIKKINEQPSRYNRANLYSAITD